METGKRENFARVKGKCSRSRFQILRENRDGGESLRGQTSAVISNHYQPTEDEAEARPDRRGNASLRNQQRRDGRVWLNADGKWTQHNMLDDAQLLFSNSRNVRRRRNTLMAAVVIACCPPTHNDIIIIWRFCYLQLSVKPNLNKTTSITLVRFLG